MPSVKQQKCQTHRLAAVVVSSLACWMASLLILSGHPHQANGLPVELDSSLLRFELQEATPILGDGFVIDSYGNPIEELKPVGSPNGKQYINTDGLEFEIPKYASGITVIRRPANDLLPPFNDAIVVAVPNVDTAPAESEQSELSEPLVEVKRAELIQLPAGESNESPNDGLVTANTHWPWNNRQVFLMGLLPNYDDPTSSSSSSSSAVFSSSSSSSSEESSSAECGNRFHGHPHHHPWHRHHSVPAYRGNSYSTTVYGTTARPATTATTTTIRTTTSKATELPPPPPNVENKAGTYEADQEESFTYRSSPIEGSSPTPVLRPLTDLVPPFQEDTAVVPADNKALDAKTAESINTELAASSQDNLGTENPEGKITLALDLEEPYVGNPTKDKPSISLDLEAPPVNDSMGRQHDIPRDLEPPFEQPEYKAEAEQPIDLSTEHPANHEVKSSTQQNGESESATAASAFPTSTMTPSASTLAANEHTSVTVESTTTKPSSAITLSLDLTPPHVENPTHAPEYRYDEAGVIQIARDLEPPPAPFEVLREIDLPAPVDVTETRGQSPDESTLITTLENADKDASSTVATTVVVATTVAAEIATQDMNPFLSSELISGSTLTPEQPGDEFSGSTEPQVDVASLTTTTSSPAISTTTTSNITPPNPLPSQNMPTEQALIDTLTTSTPITSELVTIPRSTPAPSPTQTLTLINQINNGNPVTLPSPLLLPPLKTTNDSDSDAAVSVGAPEAESATQNSLTDFAASTGLSPSDFVTESLTPLDINAELGPSKVEFSKSADGKVISTATRKDDSASSPTASVDADGRYTGGFGGPPGLLRPLQPAANTDATAATDDNIYVAGNKHDFSRNVNKVNSNTSDQAKYRGGFGAPAGVLSPNASGLRPFRNTASSTAAPNFGGPPGVLVPYDTAKN